MNEYMNLLGLKAKDRISGFNGVVTTVAFDLYGCVQVIITPEVDKEGKPSDGIWFDAKRLEVTSERPVMTPPTFDTLPAGKEKGPAAKPPMPNKGTPSR